MLTTAKNLQLMDSDGVNISPVTDITSLYYEVERNVNDTSIIARKYIYSGFPVALHIEPDIKTDIKELDEEYILCDKMNYKLVDENENHIIISNVSSSVIPGTTYRQIDIKNYDLTDILLHYTTLELFNSSIDAINTSINDLSTNLDNLYSSLNTSVFSFSDILEFINSACLIPNKFYLVNNYYYGEGGCMAVPDPYSFTKINEDETEEIVLYEYGGPSLNEAKFLLLRANTSTSLDYKLYNMYNTDNNDIGDALNVIGYYDYDSSIKITYIKDQYKNEAVYDFYNLTINKPDLILDLPNLYVYTWSNIKHINNEYVISNLLDYNNSNNIHITNNICKINPWENNILPIFLMNSADEDIEEPQYIEMNNNIIENNNNIFIYSSHINVLNNIINNQNSIICNAICDILSLTNNVINNLNNICIDTILNVLLNNICINTNNYINYNNLNNCDNIINMSNSFFNFDNLINISASIGNNNDNIINNIILNNYKGDLLFSSINKNNIIMNNINAIEKPISNQSNSAYLFNDIYAKSFNTLQ